MPTAAWGFLPLEEQSRASGSEVLGRDAVPLLKRGVAVVEMIYRLGHPLEVTSVIDSAGRRHCDTEELGSLDY